MGGRERQGSVGAVLPRGETDPTASLPSRQPATLGGRCRRLTWEKKYPRASVTWFSSLRRQVASARGRAPSSTAFSREVDIAIAIAVAIGVGAIREVRLVVNPALARPRLTM